MKRALLILLAIVVALPVAAFAAARFYLNEDALRTRIEAAVLKATGRELRIAGPIGLAWSLVPTIEARDISFANPPGFSRPAMAHVDRIEAKVALLPLLSHLVEVSGVVLTGPDVLLERDPQGRPNWIFPKPAPASTAPSTAPAEPGARFNVAVGEVAFREAKLTWQGDQIVTVAAPLLTYDPSSGRIAGDVVFRGGTLHVAGTAAPLDLRIDGAGLKLAVSGTPAAARLVADVADLSSLSGLAGTTLPPLRVVHLDTKAAFGPDTLTLDGMTLTSAQGDLAGTLTVTGRRHPVLRGALTSTRLDLDGLPPPAPPPAPAPPAAPVAQPPRPTGPVIPDTPIPYAALRGADADLQLNAAAIVWRGRTYTKIAAHIVQQDGTLRLNPVSLALGDKVLSADIRADASTQTVGAKIDAPGLLAGPVLALLGGPGASGTLDLRVDLRGQGATWRAVAATLQGQAGLAMVDGEIDNAWLLDKLQDALRAANIPLPTGGDSKIRCAALRVDAEGGKARLQTLTLDSSKLTLEGNGDIDLAAETLDLHLRPTLRLGASLSVPLRVGGTFRLPKAALDPGAIAPGRVGISIGGPAPADSCGPALALARGGETGPAPASPPPPTRPLKPADLLRGLLR